MALSRLTAFLLISCSLVHIQCISSNSFIVYVTKYNIAMSTSVLAGLLYLLYPVYGWIAEVYVSNFKIIRLSFAVLLLSSLAMLVTSAIYSVEYPGRYTWAAIVGGIAFLFSTMGLGMYESNAIQFGMDQMIEASSEQLSSYIHWYFWCAHIGPLLVFCVSSLIILLPIGIRFKGPNHGADYMFGLIMMVSTTITILLTLVNVLLLYCWKRFFHIEQITRNPMKIIYKVLQYSYQHKYPERRSAFTYWENDIPSRINLGKEKYGGPFTYEQVEDVKTVFRLLLLMVSMFGFHLLGDGYSLSNYIINTMGCPSLILFGFILLNPQYMSLLVISLSIPLYKIFKKLINFQKIGFTWSLLSRLKTGLFICLLYEALLCGYGLIIPDNSRMDCMPSQRPGQTLMLWCFESNLNDIQNSTDTIDLCTTHSTSSVIYLSIIPFVLKGIAYLLVFMTMLEFICAQCPNAMKGLLIGLWYSFLFVNYSIVNTLDIWLQRIEQTPWTIYHGVKGGLIFLSLCLFSVACRRYQYRERNEIVGEQNIIEEVYERELLLNSSVQTLESL